MLRRRIDQQQYVGLLAVALEIRGPLECFTYRYGIIQFVSIVEYLQSAVYIWAILETRNLYIRLQRMIDEHDVMNMRN